MTNTTLRGFAAGMIVSSGLIAGVYYSQTPPEKEVKAELNDSTVNTYLHSKSMTAITTEELQRLKENRVGAAPAPKEQDNSEEAKQEKPKVFKAALHVTRGMSTGEVCDFLEKENIIKDSKSFLKYLRKNKLEGQVRFGTFKVNSSMDFKKLADAIT
ncbi:hypothetical protein GA0061096_2051 [Fictibacillus enclensis]|uniref:Aminodeoxychorismate lyase n=1 Tax=Fictibacillus enclensis TaxID=1017270 RepID=A0A0V8JFF1_9BACL|nr:hypothetical protein [Fictibacillus enclensis]KSU85764.1 hypothetical protein AS030_09775 [Fictibacillus enclensis]SCC02159.1 hypothetical protein GA0061096_2051 [Fictibacillus enclensis]